MKKVVFFGGSGLLAVNWAKKICLDYEVYLIMHKRKIQLPEVNVIHFDENFEASFNHFILELKPDLIVNCAALTNVDLCESNPSVANKINTEWPKKLALLSKKVGAKFVHISTDHLFDGKKKIYDEGDQISPLNQYAKTKAAAEKEVLLIDENALIVRTNFYGWGLSYRKSFSDFILEGLRNKTDLQLFSDVFYSPIYIGELVRLIHLALEKKCIGIYNFVGTENISKYDFGLAIAEVFDLSNENISSSLIGAKKDLVLRPKNMALSNEKLLKKLNQPILTLKEQLMSLKEDEMQKAVV